MTDRTPIAPRPQKLKPVPAWIARSIIATIIAAKAVKERAK